MLRVAVVGPRRGGRTSPTGGLFIENVLGRWPAATQSATTAFVQYRLAVALAERRGRKLAATDLAGAALARNVLAATLAGFLGRRTRATAGRPMLRFAFAWPRRGGRTSPTGGPFDIFGNRIGNAPVHVAERWSTRTKMLQLLFLLLLLL